jgi:AmiR/NasT family two-component response regulator
MGRSDSLRAAWPLRSADPEACVIAFTSSDDPGELEAARKAGAVAVLPKPFYPQAFLDAVEKHARRCRVNAA